MTSDRPVALVTGAAGGIGAAIARRLAADGFEVVVHARHSVAAGRALADELCGRFVQADLVDDAQRTGLIAAVGGRLDVLVNNAGQSGVVPHAHLDAATSELWHALYDVNVVAPFRLVAAAAGLLRAGPNGCVVNISSHAGLRPKGASIPYAASKAALNHVTRLLALSLAPGIRVNAIAPGLVDTPLTAGWDEARRVWQERSPMRRGAAPAEVAEVAAMLVRSVYITGEVIVLDGGLNLT